MPVAGFLVDHCQKGTFPRLIGHNSGTPDAVAISLNPVMCRASLNNDEAPAIGGIPKEVVSVAGADNDSSARMGLHVALIWCEVGIRR